MSERIGLFGGTFDPPHRGHLALARRSFRQLRLDRLLWIVTPDPPHKRGQPGAPAEDRLAMVERALAGTPFEVSRIEFERRGPHYALDTVRLLAARYPGAELGYLMGADSLNDLPDWDRPGELVTALDFVGVMRRPGERIDLDSLEAVLPGLARRVRFVHSPLIRTASHEIRSRIARRRPYTYLLPRGVAEYIQAHQLYQT